MTLKSKSAWDCFSYDVKLKSRHWMYQKRTVLSYTKNFFFFQVLELEGEKGEWGFKALKQMIKINFKLVRFVLGGIKLIMKLYS